MPTKKLVPVIARKYLPMRSNTLGTSLIYALFSKVYGLPLYVDFIYAFLAICFFINAITAKALEVEVHPKDLS